MQGTIGKPVAEWPIGLSIYNANECWAGYTLFEPFASPIVYLLDMNGEVVHMWFISADQTRLTTNHAKYVGEGHILYQLLSQRKAVLEAWDYTKGIKSTPSGPWFHEMNWEGEVVWSYEPGGPPEDPHNAYSTIGWDKKYRPRGTHHDFQRLQNGNTLMLCAEMVINKEISEQELISDYFLEITQDGTPVWAWHSDQHFDEFGFSKETRKLIKEGAGIHMGLTPGDYLHINTLEILPENELDDQDNRFKAGNILSCQRNTNTIFIVDKKSGSVVWTWGDDQLVGPHHPNMLPNGNIIVYDNGGLAGYPRRARCYTRLVELNPVSGDIVWEYLYSPLKFHHHEFLCPSWGSVQRLPNGNTLSLDTNRGRLFEVTHKGDLVWEYVNGFMGMFTWENMKRMETGIYRCYRIPYEAVPDFSADFYRPNPGPTTWQKHPPRL